VFFKKFLFQAMFPGRLSEELEIELSEAMFKRFLWEVPLELSPSPSAAASRSMAEPTTASMTQLLSKVGLKSLDLFYRSVIFQLLYL
jgi:hypothetical protein